MLGSGLLLGVISFIGFLITFSRTPPKLQAWMEKHLVLTDLIVITGMYSLFGMTLTAHFAAAWVVIFTQGYFYISKNSEDFLWVLGLRDQLFENLENLKQWIKNKNEDYLAANPNKRPVQSGTRPPEDSGFKSRPWNQQGTTNSGSGIHFRDAQSNSRKCERVDKKSGFFGRHLNFS